MNCGSAGLAMQIFAGMTNPLPVARGMSCCADDGLEGIGKLVHDVGSAGRRENADHCWSKRSSTPTAEH